jgi:hypothetical protein
MARISRAHLVRVAFFACAAAALEALAFSPPTANADALGQVTGLVEQVVSPVAQATPSVQKVEETVTTTAQGVTARIAPSAAKAPDAVSSPPARNPGALLDQATTAASAAEPATRSAEGAVQATEESANAATGATVPTAPVPSTTDPAGSVVDPAPAVAVAVAPSVTGPADSSTAPTDLPALTPRTTYVPPPGNNGSTGAPLPRWIAYVWPAVALTGPSLANFVESWGQAIVRLATGASAGNGAEGGVAGVHASGGRPEAAGSSPLFSRIPSDVGHAFSSVPTPVFVYLGLLVLAVIAVALAVRREIAIGRRQ